MTKVKCLPHLYWVFFVGCLFGTTPLFASSNNNSRLTVQDQTPVKKVITSQKRTVFARSQFLNPAPLIHSDRKKRWVGEYRFRLSGESLNSAKNIQSDTMGMSATLRMDYRLLNNISLEGRGKLKFESGRTQDLFGDLEPDNTFYVRSAVVHGRFLNDRLSLKTGILSQGFFKNPLFIKNLGFPGLREKIQIINGKSFRVSAMAQQVIPTSSTLSTRVQEKEKSPRLFTESLIMDWDVTSLTRVQWMVSQFNYKNLPHIVAYRSQILGNTFTNGNENDTEFKFGFSGWMSHFLIEQGLGRNFSLRFEGNFQRNVEALDRYNESRSLTLATALNLGNWNYVLSGESFFVEPDAVPAFYNDWLRGHNNRIGWGGEFAVESQKNNFRFGVRYYDADLLNPRGVVAQSFQQDDLKTFYLFLETAYESF